MGGERWQHGFYRQSGTVRGRIYAVAMRVEEGVKKYVPLLFVIGWSCVTAFFAWHVASGCYRQFRTYDYASTRGTITHMEQTTEPGDEGGETYGVKADYSYTVDGQRQEGTRVRYAADSSNDNWAYLFVKQHPAGSEVTVYYDRKKPVESVLIQGLQGSDCFMMTFMTPFVCIALLLPLLLIWNRKRNGSTELSRRQDGEIVRLRASLWIIPGSFAAGLGMGACLAIFVVAFGFGGFHPSMQVMKVAWGAIAVVTLVSGCATAFWIMAGKGDLVLDGQARVLRFKGREIAYAQIASFLVRREEANEQISYSLWAEEAGSQPKLRLRKWMGDAEGDSARRMAGYLSRIVGVPALDETGKQIGVASRVD